MNQDKTILIISIIGITIFSMVLLVSFAFNKHLEKTALVFIKGEITSNLHQRVNALSGINEEDPNIAQRLFLSRYKDEVLKIKNELKTYVSSVVNCISENTDVTDKQIMEATASITLGSELWKYERIKSSFEALSSLVKEKYKKTWKALNNDIRFFSGVNLGCFLLLLIISSYFKPVPEYLRFVSWLLLISTFACVFLYIFSQNWVYTILFDKYFGTGYFVMLSFIFLYLLWDGTVSYITEKSNKTKH